MRVSRTLALAVAVAAAGPAAAQPTGPATLEEGVRFVQRAVIQYGLLAARSAVDLTYDGVTADPRSGDLVLEGLILRPRLDWDPERACEIAIDRIAIPATGAAGIDSVRFTAQLDGLVMAPECLEPGVGLALQSFAYERVEVESAAIRVSYHLPSAAADLEVSARVADAARVSLTAAFDYLWFTGVTAADDERPPEPRPAAKLASAELVIENAGAWERLRPLVEQQAGNLDTLPQMVRALMGQMLAGPSGQVGPEARAFIDNVATEVARFAQKGDRLVVTLAPEGGVWLEESLFQTPAQMLAALEPRVSAAPSALADMIAPQRLSAALAEGAEPDPAERLAVGRALLTGIGAPLSPAEGRDLLAPLAEDWDPAAARLIAEAALEAGETARAHAMALRARAGGAAGAGALLARLEGRLDAGEIVTAQEAAFTAWPGKPDWTGARDEAIEAGDVTALAMLAADAEAGRGMPRSYTQAYYLAGLAAAAGDRGAAALRERITARFTGGDGVVEPGWAEARASAAAATLRTWTEGGLAGRIAERYASEE